MQQGLRRGQWADVRYRGDWMRRPIASNELAVLVRTLLWISDALNRSLGLDGPPPEGGPSPPSIVQVRGLSA